jgi:hypothetical protein
MPDSNSIFVQIIADYGPVGDMAFAEVRQALRYALRDKIAHMELSPVSAFDTVATGFYLAQLANNHKMGSRQFFYVNTAPRKDDPRPRVNNAGEGLAYVRLKDGVQIVAVNSGYSLSFVKEHAEEMRVINCSAEGSQFRSRDVFPEAFGKIVHGDTSQLGNVIKISDLPDLPESVVGYTDGYGNIKTTIDAKAIESLKGKKVIVTIGEYEHEAMVADGIFAVPDGGLVLSAGSSGWKRADGSALRFVEVSLRSGSASRLFKRPKGGAKISWKTV